jgi:myo-inositol 2-dehydrogenase/D-chiro-inositol 1-dehydrogenase
VLFALQHGKPVLVEKPLAVDLGEADRLIAAAAQSGCSLHVGYSRRFKKRYLLAKEQLTQGRLGQVTGAAARVYNSRSQAMQTLARMSGAKSCRGANLLHRSHELAARGQ